MEYVEGASLTQVIDFNKDPKMNERQIAIVTKKVRAEEGEKNRRREKKEGECEGVKRTGKRQLLTWHRFIYLLLLYF